MAGIPERVQWESLKIRIIVLMFQQGIYLICMNISDIALLLQLLTGILFQRLLFVFPLCPPQNLKRK